MPWNLMLNVVVVEGTSFEKRLGQEDGAHPNGISALTKEISES